VSVAAEPGFICDSVGRDRHTAQALQASAALHILSDGRGSSRNSTGGQPERGTSEVVVSASYCARRRSSSLDAARARRLAVSHNNAALGVCLTDTTGRGRTVNGHTRG